MYLKRECSHRRQLVYYDKFRGHENAGKYFYDRWREALKAVKLLDRRSHDIRREVAIRRDAAGILQDSNMRLGGWKTPAMLQQYLEGKDIEGLRAATNLLDAQRTSKNGPEKYNRQK